MTTSDSSRLSPKGALAEVPTAMLHGLAQLETSFGDSGPLPQRVVHLALALALTNKGRDDAARYHAELAVQAGLTRPEVVETLFTAVLSRGPAMVIQNQWLIEMAGPGEGMPEVVPPEPTEPEVILDYFGRTFGQVPEWIRQLAETAPAALQSYYAMRALTLSDGVLDRKYKELVLVVINSVERYDVGLSLIHI